MGKWKLSFNYALDELSEQNFDKDGSLYKIQI